MPTLVAPHGTGLREGHEPYRHLATQAAQAFLDTGSPFLPKAAQAMAKPLRLALQVCAWWVCGMASDS